MIAPSGPHDFTRGQFIISTDPSRLDLYSVHEFLTTASWSEGISLEDVARAVEYSVPFGVYFRDKQIGFARVVSDFNSFAWLADVFVVESYRGHGLGRWLVETIVAHPDLAAIKRFMLATRDAQWLYAQFGFEEMKDAWRYMVKSTY